ncbi:MAG: DUF177 domain-containing protein [Bryobacteraceae bacterium]
MFLNIKDMEFRKVRFDETFEPGVIDFLDVDIRQVGPLHAEGSAEMLENTGGQVRVTGRYSVMMEAECDRCLAPARCSLNETVDLFYQPASQAAEAAEEDEIDEGAVEIAFYEGLGMELADVLKEQILLALPMQRVCKTECKGICATCGANRNESDCQCYLKPAEDRWKALKNL